MADLHAYLDNQKAPWELLEHRTKYYEHLLKATLRAMDVPIEDLEFVVGTSYQLTREYSLDGYRLAAIVTEHDAKKAGAEVVKAVEHPLLSSLIYPGLQALDEEYLKVDAQFGGTDQRKIFTYAEKYMPQLGYKKRIHLMNFMVPGLMGAKMSSSDPDSKIDLLDDRKTVERKIKKAFCEEGNVTENGLLSFSKFVLFPIYSLKGKPGFEVKRKPDFGGNVTFKTYSSLEDAFAKKELHPGDLKVGVAAAINELLEPIRQIWAADPELAKLTERAYPSAKSEKKQQQGGGAKGGNKPTVPTNTNEDVSRLDIRVGKIVSVSRHPDADSLYVEQIDLGEAQPRTIVSGLVKYFTPEQLTGQMVCVLANLKPSKLRGVMSEGMVLCANSEDGELVELVSPPPTVPVGERVQCHKYRGEADPVLNPRQKFYGLVMAKLKTNAAGVATYEGEVLETSKGAVTVKSLKDATIR